MKSQRAAFRKYIIPGDSIKVVSNKRVVRYSFCLIKLHRAGVLWLIESENHQEAPPPRLKVLPQKVGKQIRIYNNASCYMR